MIFTPLAWGGMVLGAITIVEGMAAVLALLWLWRMNNKSGWKFKPTKLDGPIWIFVVLAVISAVFSIYKYASMLELLRLLTYVAVYYLAVNHFDRRLQLRFFVLIIVMGAALSLLGIGQYFFGLDHWWWSDRTYLSATYVGHAHFAGYLEMVIALNCGLLFGLNKEDTVSSFQLAKWRLLLIAALGLMLTAFILTQSRGGWFALAIASVVLFVVLATRKLLSKGAVPIFVLGLIFFVGFLAMGEDRTSNRLQTIEISEEGRFFKARPKVWGSSIDIVKANPVIGTGIGTFVWAFPKYRPEGFRVRFYYAHNEYIHMTTEMGIMVIPLLLWGIFIVLKGGFSRDPKDFQLQQIMRIACGVGVLSLILHGLVDFNFHISSNMLLFVCLVGIIMREESGRRA